MKILLVLVKYPEKQKLSFSRSALFYIKTRVCLKYIVNDCSLVFLKFKNCLFEKVLKWAGIIYLHKKKQICYYLELLDY